MYLNEKKIKRLKIKNVIVLAIAIFNLVLAVSWELYLFIRYFGDWFTLSHAKATPEFFFWIIVGPAMIIHALKSFANIGDANFYNGYFEGDLDGLITVEELADVTGKKISNVKNQMKKFSKSYMKNFKLVEGDKTYVELESKTAMCECRNCGAMIEKRIYFVGQCPHCNSSDLRAKVVTDGRFYSISNELNNRAQSYEYYTAKNLPTKQVLFPMLMGLSIFVIFIMVASSLDLAFKYNDQEYLRSILLDPDRHLQSYELIHYDMISDIVMNMFIAIGLVPVLINRIKRIGYVKNADKCAKVFKGYKVPFVPASKLPGFTGNNDASKVRYVRKTMKTGYLKHCTFERHSGELQVALAKKIVKDECPTCAAPITDAVYKDYVCKYCGNKIMDVVVKK